MGTSETTQMAIDRLLTEFVEQTPGVRGAVIGSADGLPISAHLHGIGVDAATVAAMGSAMLGLSAQLVRLGTDATTANTHVRGNVGQVWVLDIGRSASLTVLGADEGDAQTIAGAADAAAKRLVALLIAATR